ncbi:unnamed protein product, partial [Symbiodinium necroappetens]
GSRRRSARAVPARMWFSSSGTAASEAPSPQWAWRPWDGTDMKARKIVRALAARWSEWRNEWEAPR